MIELERAMRGAAKRKVDAGIEPRNPVRDGLRLQGPRVLPGILIAVVIISALSLLGLIVWYLSQVPPGHILIISIIVGIIWFWGRDGKKK